MKPFACLFTLVAVALLGQQPAGSALVQPFNYMLEDSLVSQPDGGSLAPFHNDQSADHSADRDVVGILGDSLARLRFARMLDDQQPDEAQSGQLSAEMSELANSERPKDEQQDSSLGSSVASMLMNVAQAAAEASASAAADESAQPAPESSRSALSEPSVSARGNIMELDTSPAAPTPSKSDLKSVQRQWFNPKETIPVLKISSMATPSKYKKVYFRSEKKLVDGAFHSPSSEHEEKKSLVKSLNSGLQRRSSRGTSSSVAPPSVLQDGVIDFLKKFRDVYVQTRPASGQASSALAAAASSPFAAVLAPSSGRPNLSSALSAASQMVSSAALVAQAASGSAGSPAAAAATSSASSPIKSPISAQSYVSFWSKTFPTWVKKMLKQMRRRSLYNSSKRQQHQQSALGHAAQAAASGAVASALDAASSAGSSSSSAASSH